MIPRNAVGEHGRHEERRRAAVGEAGKRGLLCPQPDGLRALREDGEHAQEIGPRCSCTRHFLDHYAAVGERQRLGVRLVLCLVALDAFGRGVGVWADHRQRQVGLDHKTIDGGTQLFGQRDAAVHGAV